MSPFDRLIAKIATIDSRAEMQAFLAALREEDPTAISDDEVQLAIGARNAEILRDLIRAADDATSKGANAA